MNAMEMALIGCAVIQIAVAVLNLFLVRILGWTSDLERMSLLPRQVFHVHVVFISMTLLIFGVLTVRFHDIMAGGLDPVASWLAGGIALFWGIRTVMQVTYYSASHWRGKTALTIAHVSLLLAYGFLTVCYGVAAI
jgi:hypothetical protein